MFTSARLKLTAWYLLILMAVSFLFSTIIYRMVSSELERGFHQAVMRMHARRLGLLVPVNEVNVFFLEDINDAKLRVLRGLLITNGGILAFGALAGYVLAGKTLAPIKETLEEQKRFTADASHELHTPLTAMKTTLEVALRDKKLTTKHARVVLRDNLTQVDELTDLTQGLLSLSRTDTNGSSFHFTRVDVTSVISEVIRRFAPLADRKKITLTTHNSNCIIEADEMSISKLITILIDNALKYTPGGGKVTLTAEQTAKELELTVSDTGIGIAKNEVPHIFDRFYRADQSRNKDKKTGFGLGLAIAKRIVELHHGKISVASKLRLGTSITVILPLNN